MKKRVIAILLSTLLVVAMLSGCGSKGTTTDNGNSESDKVTISYGIWDKNQEPVVQELIKEFNKTHANIEVKVELTPWGQYWTKLETAATGGVVPDVFWMNGPNAAKYVSGGILAPLNEYIEADKLDLGKYPQGLVDLYTIEDKLYGIPKDFDVTALWYNKEIFDKAGVEYPTDAWTWNDMVEAARKLTNKSEGIYGVAFTTDNQVGIYNTINQTGGYVISDDRKKSGYDLPETKKGIQVWVDLIEEGISPSLQDSIDTPVDDLFQSGKLAMNFAASWMVSPYMQNESVKDKIDLVVMPKIDQRAAVIHGLGNAIYSKTKHPQEAWELVKFLSSKEANDIWAESGTVIPAYKESLELWKESYSQINLQAYVEALEYSYMYPSSKETAKWNAIEGEYLKRIWAGEMSVEEGCKIIAEEMNKILQEE